MEKLLGKAFSNFGLCRTPEIRLLDQRQECIYQLSVQLFSFAAFQFFGSALEDDCGAVLTVGGHSIEGVYHSDETRFFRNFVATQMVWVTGTVDSLVMRSDSRQDMLELGESGEKLCTA